MFATAMRKSVLQMGFRNTVFSVFRQMYLDPVPIIHVGMCAQPVLLARKFFARPKMRSSVYRPRQLTETSYEYPFSIRT